MNDFLAYARPSPPRFTQSDLNRTVSEVVRFLSAELQQRGIAIETTLHEPLSAVEMDEGQIRQSKGWIILRDLPLLAANVDTDLGTLLPSARVVPYRLSLKQV